jgi:long-chain acyl-CoA synthetase
MLEEYGARFLVTDEAIDAAGVTVFPHELLSASDDGREWDLPDPEDTAVVVFTTGTTGRAKGVMHSHRTHMRCARGWVREWGFGHGDVFLSVQPLERAGGMFHHYCAILAGGTAVHHGGVVFAARVFEAIKQYGVSVMYMQAPALRMLMDSLGDAFAELSGRIRILGTGGAAVSEALKTRLRRMMPNTDLYVLFAATEHLWIAYYKFNDKPGKPNCVGPAAPGNKLFVLDENRNPRLHSDNRNGIIAVESDYNFIGYMNDDELTKTAIVNGRLLMTDMGYMDASGYLYILGRRDDVIETGGYKVAPYEIEEVAARMDGVSECACVGVPDAVLGWTPKLFVRMEKGAAFSAREISGFLSQRLESYKLPRSIVEVEDFPRVGETPKINRKELKNS